MKALIRFLCAYAMPGKFFALPGREMTDAELRGALAQAQIDNQQVRAVLEMILDRAAAANELALARDQTPEQRVWNAGAASALLRLVGDVLRLTDPTAPPR